MSVYKHINGKWYYKFVIDGIQYHRACKGATEFKAARKCEIEALDAVCENGSKYKKKKPITVNDAMDRYEKYARENKDSYKTDLKFIKRIKKFFGINTIFTTITPSQIDDFREAIKFQEYERIEKVINPEYPEISKKKYINKKIIVKKELSASTIKKHINAISKTFNLLNADGKIDMRNPCTAVKKPREDDTHIRVISKNELKKMFLAIRKLMINIIQTTKDKELINTKTVHLIRLAQFIICGLQAGLRKTEMFELKRTQVDMNSRIITILYSRRYKTKNKGSRFREIPISSKLYKIFQHLIKNSNNTTEWLFVNPITQKPYTSVDKTFKNILNLSKLNLNDDENDITLHTLRHTFATRLALNGADVKTLQELLGHESIETTMIYYHTNINQKKKVIKILDNFIV